MLFPEVSVESWCKENPPLEVRTDRCDECGADLKAEIPFIDSKWVGLTSKKCKCGNTLSVSTPRKIATNSVLVDNLEAVTS